MSLSDLVRNYNDSVREAVDKHSLVRTKVVTLRQKTFTCPNVCGAELNSKSIVRFSKRKVMLVADFFSKVTRTTTRKNIFGCGNDTKNIQIYKQVNGGKSGCRFAD